MSSDAVLANLLAWSLQVLSVVLIGGGLPWLLRLHAPDVRHLYWRALLLACLILPAVQPWQEVSSLSADLTLPAALSATAPGLALTSAGPLPRVRPLAVAAPGGRWGRAIAVVLLSGTLVRLAWLAAGFVRLRRLRRAGAGAAPIEGEDGIGPLPAAGVDVRYVAGLAQPVTFGVVKPVILLPDSLRSHPPAVQHAVFVHELWHVRRRDWLWVVIEEVVRAVLWFHPAIAWLVTQVQSSREEVVDELTVQATNARRSYLEALLTFADEPSVYPAMRFARRRHLFQRMLLISKEAVMSSRRIVVSCAVMGAVVVAGSWCGAAAFPLRTVTAQRAQGQPRDLRPGEARPASPREAQLLADVKAQPTPAVFFELARLQEERGATAAAEATLMAARTALPGERAVLMAQAGFYNRAGRFDEAVRAVGEASALSPSDATGHYVVATFYEDKVRKDPSLAPASRAAYAQAGIAAADRALALNAEFLEAMIVKNLLLRLQSNLESDPAARAQLIADADQLRMRALDLQKGRQLSGGTNPQTVRTDSASGRMPPPPPPPPPPPGSGPLVDGLAPVRVGGNIKQPVKLLNVAPVYPQEALDARVTGVVIIEATIDTAGSVHDTRVLRSIPPLDQAAIDAVKQWQFTPTLMNGQPVPVIMTVTVNFTLQ